MKKNGFLNWIKNISYSFLPLAIFLVTLLVSFFFNMWWGKHEGMQIFITLDDYIPQISEFVYIYYLTFPTLFIMYFYLATVNRADTYNLAFSMIASFAISGFFYYFLQTEMIKPDFISSGSFADELVVATWNIGYPVNCFPSQHCFMGIALNIAAFTQKKMKWWARTLFSIIGILVVFSTVLIKQHFVLDFFASFVIILPIFCLFKILRVGEKIEEKTLQRKIKQKRIIS